MIEQDTKPGRSRWQEVKGMIKRHPIVTIVLILVLVAGGVFFVLRTSQANTPGNGKGTKVTEQSKQEEKKLPVEVAVAKRGPISSWIITNATLEADRQVTIASETTGVVSKIMVEEGAAVGEGQVLAVLSDSKKEVALQNAIIRLKNSEHELQRKQASYDQKIISQADYDKAKFEKEVAESEKKAAEVELSRLMIRAPFSGIVTERFIEKGQNITAGTQGTQLFTLVDREPLKARIYLPEKEVFGIHPDQQVLLTLNAQKDVAFRGKIKQINPSVDPKSGTIKVTLEINQAPDEVRPGSFVDVRLVTQKHENALLIPKKALIEEAGEQYVFLIQKGAAIRKTVQIGFTDDENAEVMKGLYPGNAVVIAGQGSLREGTKTQIVASR
jgi:membrane fusion protein, multidrug efflux system